MLSFEGDIVVVDKEEQVAAACEDLASCRIIGFDTETRPAFKAGLSYKVSLLQLSTPKTCYLFRLNKIALSRPILHILESNDIIKLGADVVGDIRALNELRRFKDRGFLDLQGIIWRWGVEEKSLRKMSAIMLGYRISKAQRLSNWEAVALTPQQQQYAATDAWACIEIYNKMQAIGELSPEEIAQIEEDRRLQAIAAAERRAAKEEERRQKMEAAGLEYIPRKSWKEMRKAKRALKQIDRDKR
ncbi:MAG: 3'-5' exonuclease [Rikenellaceae bacterium]